MKIWVLFTLFLVAIGMANAVEVITDIYGTTNPGSIEVYNYGCDCDCEFEAY